MSPAALQAFKDHAAAEMPKEACGWLVAVGGEQSYFPSRNRALQPTKTFETDPRDWLTASAAGRIVAVCHSHPFGSSTPSPGDKTACEKSGLPWHILAWPLDTLTEIRPCGYAAPLLGRPFVHGVHDCYALTRDYFKQELGIEIPDFERPELWWEDRPGRPALDLLTLERFEEAGFVKVDGEFKLHDGLVMQLGRTRKPNHCGVHVGGGVMLHHLFGQLSGRTVFGGQYQKCLRYHLRHRELM